jgi:HAD superfamily hydrolase (TIGR01549 family)
MALDAMIFDIDGTLIDSNPAHVEAWQLAFEGRGYRIAADRIEVEIGKGGDRVVPDLLGTEADERDGDALRQAQPREFAKIGKAQGLRSFPRAVELLRELRGRGIKVVLATSSNGEQFKALTEAAGVDLTTECDAMTTADDARESKPAPDIVAAAVKKVGLSPAQCAMVGDTLYDMQAAKHAGVIGLGVLTGYQSAQTLKEAGARAVWRDVGEVLRKLDEVLRVASPAPIQLTVEAQEELMRQALAVAREGMAAGEAPIAGV